MLDRDQILSICAPYASPGFFAVGDAIPWEKQETARASLRIPADEAVLALADFLADASNREGMAVCDGGVWWHSAGAHGRLSWSALSAENPSLEGAALRLDAGWLRPRAPGGARLLVDVLNSLRAAAWRAVSDTALPAAPSDNAPGAVAPVFRVNRLLERLHEFRRSLETGSSDLHLEGEIPPEKLENATKHYPIPGDERVIALLDCTLFGSAKAGLAVGTRGIYWRAPLISTGSLAWTELPGLPVKKGFTSVKMGSTMELDISGSQLSRGDAERLLTLLRDWAAEEVAALSGSGPARDSTPPPLGDSGFEQWTDPQTGATGFRQWSSSSSESGFAAFDEASRQMMDEMQRWTSGGRGGFPEIPGFPDFPDFPDFPRFPHAQPVGGNTPPPPPAARAEPPPPPAPAYRWMFALDGAQFGPFEEQTVWTMVEAGEIDPERCFAWREGMPDWRAFREVPELAAMLGDRPRPMTPPPPPPRGHDPPAGRRRVDY